MTSLPPSRQAPHGHDLRLLEALLCSCVPGVIGQDPGTPQRVWEALRAGEVVAEIMLCLPGDTDAMAALQFARAALDWWDHRLVIHEHVLTAVAAV